MENSSSIWLISSIGSWSYWVGAESKACQRAGWTCDEMCSWSKWESCNTKVHRKHSSFWYWLYNFFIPRSSCDTFNASLWLPRHTGNFASVIGGTVAYCFSVHFFISVVIEMFIYLFIYFCLKRVLEHCNDQLQTQFIVDEILESVCTLIQDQYGNYVTQVDFVCFFNLC